MTDDVSTVTVEVPAPDPTPVAPVAVPEHSAPSDVALEQARELGEALAALRTIQERLNGMEARLIAAENAAGDALVAAVSAPSTAEVEQIVEEAVQEVEPVAEPVVAEPEEPQEPPHIEHPFFRKHLRNND